MTVTPPHRPDAFFVGDHLAMDFLNSITNDGTEWLGNGHDLIGWLETAGAIDPPLAAKFRAEGDPRRLDAVSARARDLRDWLRGFLHTHGEEGMTASVLADLGPLNDLLAEDDSYGQVVAAHGEPGGHQPLHFRRLGRWTGPDQLLQPIASAIAGLVCDEDLGLVRTCEGSACTLMFLDRTKSHARRWCSMAVCGNRAKAAAHRARATRKSA
jgi:predicted RNA-binding Zn ribbon-like protein